MANIVYMPQRQSIGGALGQGMSLGIMKGLEKQEQQEKTAKFKEWAAAVQKAPDRASAMELLPAAMNMAQDPADINMLFGIVDKMHPQKDDTPQAVEYVGEDNKPGTAYVPRGQLSDPEKLSSFLPPGARIGKPEPELEFIRPGKPGTELSDSPEGPTPPMSLGRFPASKRPEPGAQTTEEITLARQIAADQRAEQIQERAEDREARLERTAAAQEKVRAAAAARATSADERRNANTTADNFSRDAARGTRSLLAITGGKMLETGEFTFTGPNEKKLFFQRLPHFERMLADGYASSKGGVVNVSEVVERAIQKFPADESKPEKPPAELPVKKEEPGFLGRLFGGKPEVDLPKGAGGLPIVKSDADYAKVPGGTKFIDEKGEIFTKPKKK